MLRGYPSGFVWVNESDRTQDKKRGVPEGKPALQTAARCSPDRSQIEMARENPDAPNRECSNDPLGRCAAGEVRTDGVAIQAIDENPYSGFPVAGKLIHRASQKSWINSTSACPLGDHRVVKPCLIGPHGKLEARCLVEVVLRGEPAITKQVTGLDREPYPVASREAPPDRRFGMSKLHQQDQVCLDSPSPDGSMDGSCVRGPRFHQQDSRHREDPSRHDSLDGDRRSVSNASLLHLLECDSNRSKFQSRCRHERCRSRQIARRCSIEVNRPRYRFPILRTFGPSAKQFASRTYIPIALMALDAVSIDGSREKAAPRQEKSRERFRSIAAEVGSIVPVGDHGHGDVLCRGRKCSGRKT